MFKECFTRTSYLVARTPTVCLLSAKVFLRSMLFLLGTLPAFAGTFTVFGPQRYARTNGAPVTVSDIFSILNPNTQYTLHVENTGVASAVISINGIQVLGPNDFDPKVSAIDRSVSLQLQNRIDVQLRSVPDSSLTVSILGVDNDAPVITAVASPTANAAGWNKTGIIVTFTCTDATSGIAFCPAPIAVNTDGANEIVTGQARDQAGNIASTSVSVNLDMTPPNLAVILPANGATITTSTNSIGLNGTASDALSGLSTVTCNGTPAQIMGSNFSCTVPLTQGPNAIAIQANDLAGNSVGSTLNLIYAPVPKVTITSPANFSFTNTSPATVMGTVSDPHATLTVNGIPVPLISGAFSVSTPLAEGLNTLAAVATNAAGISGTASIQITLDTASQGPVIQSIAPVAAVASKLMQYQMDASSTNSNTLAFSLLLAPSGMTIDSKSGLVSWSPGSDQIGDHPVVVSAQDSTGQTSQSFTISVFGTRVKASATISAAIGGTLDVSDPTSTINGLSVVIPPGALAVDTIFTVSELVAPPTLGGTSHFFMRGFAIEPDGTTLSIPARVTFPYQPSQFGTRDGLPLENFLGIYFLQSSNGNPEFLNSYSIDVTNHVITALLPHFSAWIVTNIARLCPPPISGEEGDVIVGCPNSDPINTPSLVLPTILVHGFQLSDMGDESTWGNLRRLLAIIGRGAAGRIDSWRFDWASRSVPFEKSAQNLRAALLHVESLETTSGPHLVNLLAHSFGGILVRTYLEGQATNAPFLHDVNRVATLGTPHTGIGGKFSIGLASACANIAQLLSGPFITCFEAGTGGGLLPFGTEGNFLRNLNNNQPLPTLEETISPSYLHIKGQRLAGSPGASALVSDDGLITIPGAQLCGETPDVCSGTTVLEETFPPGTDAVLGLCHSRSLLGKTCDSRLHNVPMAEINDASHPLWPEICQFLGCAPTVNVFITDGGTVTSDDGMINCGTICSAVYSGGSTVTLTANPSAGHIFTGWSFPCTGTASTCVISIPTDFPYSSSSGSLFGGFPVGAAFTVPITASITSLSCIQSGVEPILQTITASGIATGPGNLAIQIGAGAPPFDPTQLSPGPGVLLSFDCGAWVTDRSTLTCQQPPTGPIQTNWEISGRLEWFTRFGNNIQLVGEAGVVYFPDHVSHNLAGQSVACTMQ